jgi:hypothetical protein
MPVARDFPVSDRTLSLWAGKGYPLHRTAFISAVRDPLIRADMADGILGHSFRIGGATILAAAGYPDHVIKLAGRWSSDAFLTYVRRHHQFLPQTVMAIAKLPFPAEWQPATNNTNHSRARGMGQ